MPCSHGFFLGQAFFYSTGCPGDVKVARHCRKDCHGLALSGSLGEMLPGSQIGSSHLLGHHAPHLTPLRPFSSKFSLTPVNYVSHIYFKLLVSRSLDHHPDPSHHLESSTEPRMASLFTLRSEHRNLRAYMQLCHFCVQSPPATLPKSSDLKPVDHDPLEGGVK